jgi:hypothetical protein
MRRAHVLLSVTSRSPHDPFVGGAFRGMLLCDQFYSAPGTILWQVPKSSAKGMYLRYVPDEVDFRDDACGTSVRGSVRSGGSA